MIQPVEMITRLDVSLFGGIATAGRATTDREPVGIRLWPPERSGNVRPTGEAVEFNLRDDL
jgi:hypothetical protein